MILIRIECSDATLFCAVISMMKQKNSTKPGKRISRRTFAGKTIIALAAAGLLGYTAFNTRKLRAVNNIRKMGHCAPSVMKTLLDINEINNENLVLYAGGMAGGIAGPVMECGVLTSPLIFMGYQHDNPKDISEKLEIICRARYYVNEFTRFNGATSCSMIRQKGMPACMKAVRNFNRLFTNATSAPVNLTTEEKESFSLLLKSFDANKFHCACNVLNSLNKSFPVKDDLYNSSLIFVGGIALLNRTCDALTAGVLALSSATARIENSYSRVARMNRLLRQKSPEAMDEEINNFNRSINLSEELGIWFRREFGSTNCFDIWRLDFSKIKNTERYLADNCMLQCRYVADKVAEKVLSMI